jgi:hypothetical protein
MFRTLSIVLFFLCSSGCSYAQSTDSTQLILDPDWVIKSYASWSCGTVEKTYRKNGEVKREIFDDWNGNRVYLRHVGKKKIVRRRYKSSWARNSLPPCRQEF